ncbi:MAG TPA: hemolysin [Lachnospiraceae bacterium]|jgi:CBS domain containing-hemolysin-like protein|nr:hemolysin [Lachnospiraceae bacterium]
MDPDAIVKLVVLIVLLILSGVFSSAETALTTVNMNKLKALCDEGNRRAAKVIRLRESSSKLLTTVLIGNNIVNLSASALATTLCTEVFGSAFIGVATGILTLVVLVFGEIAPKTLATLYSLRLSLFFAYPVAFLMLIFTPIIWILNGITAVIFKILRVDLNKKEHMTESELRTIVDVSHEDGVIEKDEKEMITNVVDFGEVVSKDIMVPRADMVCVDADSGYDELLEIIKKENFSRIPVYRKTRDHIIGILHVKDVLLLDENEKKHFRIDKVMRKPIFVYEYQHTAKIFAGMKTSSATMCIVIDEYGLTAGLITMEDLLEEIVGDLRDEYDTYEDDLIRKVGEDHYDIDASVKIDDVNDAIGTNLESEDYDSIGGYVIELLDRIPEEGDEVEDGNVRIKVTSAEKKRAVRVELFVLPKEESQEDEEE